MLENGLNILIIPLCLVTGVVEQSSFTSKLIASAGTTTSKIRSTMLKAIIQ